MLAKFQEEMDRKDREDIQRTMAAVLFGHNNKKRKRDDVDALDGEDSNRRKIRLIEERYKERTGLNANPDDLIRLAQEQAEE